jgi:ribosome recycling factor
MLFDQAKLQQDLQKTEKFLADEFRTLRTGRPRVEMLDGVMVQVEQYGNMDMEVRSLANVSVEQMDIVISVFDPKNSKDVIKGITSAELGGSVSDEGGKIRIKFPPMTSEKRDETVKKMHQMVENARISMRNTRRSYMQEIDKLEGVSEDEQKRSREEVQKIVDKFDEHLGELAKQKEEEIKTI